MRFFFLFLFLFFGFKDNSFSKSDSVLANYLTNYSTSKDLRNLFYSNNIFLQETANHGEKLNYFFGDISSRLIEFNYLNRSLNDPYNFHNYFQLLPNSLFFNSSLNSRIDYTSNSLIGNSLTKQLPITLINFKQSAYDGTDFKILFNTSITQNSNFTFELNKNSIGNKRSVEFYKARFQNSFNDSWQSRILYNYKTDEGILFSINNILSELENGINAGINYSAFSDSMYDDLNASARSLTTFNNSKVNHFDANLLLPLLQDSILNFNLQLYNSKFYTELKTYDNLLDSNFSPLDLRNKHNSSINGFYTSLDLSGAGKSISVYYKYERHNVEENNFVSNHNSTKSFVGINSNFKIANFIFNAELDNINYKNHNGLNSFANILWNADKHLIISASVLNKTIFPTFQEVYWSDVITFQPVERNLKPIKLSLTSFGGKYEAENFLISLNVNSSNIENNIVPDYLSSQIEGERNFLTTHKFYNTSYFQTGKEENNIFINYQLNYFKSKINYNLNFTQFLKSQKSFIPKYYGFTDIFYSDNYFKNSLMGIIGFKFEYFSDYYAQMLIYPSREFIYQNEIKINKENILSAYIRGHVNQVIIEFEANNLLNNKYMTIPLYPMMPQNYTFKISWQFEN
ncbi:MAG: hypothetical protein O3A55_04710 [Bacteroidetes bacterium]|nr:hypothetical protein [Bacteroidota bacterium]